MPIQKTPQSPENASGRKEKPSVDRSAGKASEPRIRIPDGKYHAQAVTYKTHNVFGKRRTYLCLKIVDLLGPHHGKEIYCVFSVHTNYRPRSKLYKTWTMLKERPPRRNEEISVKHLIGNIFEIKARTVSKNEHGELHPEVLQYSVADITALVQKNG